MIKILDNYILSKMASDEEVIPITVSKPMLKFIKLIGGDALVERSVADKSILRYSSFGITLHFYNSYYEDECNDQEFEYFLLNEIAKNYNK